jgi:hypothetical protein
MVIRVAIASAVALLLAFTAPSARAQDELKQPKGTTMRNLVTSLGGFTATVNAPILVTGSTLEIAPGGHTGRHQFRVPTFVYVVDGTLTSEYEAGPVGIMGAQYHATGQSFMDNGGWWHNYFNRGQKPLKLIILHLGYPGRPDPIVRSED